MQQAIPYRTWAPARMPVAKNSQESATEDVAKRAKVMVQENTVLVFGRRGCCMCLVMKQLLLVLGVNPVACEVDEEEEVSVVDELATIGSGRGKESRPQFPSVYIGGKLFGDLDRLMSAHISGELKPVLKQAGALWL